MWRKRGLIIICSVIGMVAAAAPALAAHQNGGASAQAGGVTISPSRQDTSPALTSIPPAQPRRGGSIHGARQRHGAFADIAETPQDVANPAPVSSTTAPSTPTNWDGGNNTNGVLPPDTNGDVGPNHYVQWVNLSYQVWHKSGTSLYGPVSGNTLWSGLGGLCQSTNDGDPVVLYDKLAKHLPGKSDFYGPAPVGVARIIERPIYMDCRL